MGDLAPLSPANARVKRAAELRRRSARTERRLFLAEGVNALEAALAADCLVEVFATAEGAARIAERLADERLDVTLVDDRGMRKLSDAVTPPGAIAVCRTPDEVGLEQCLDQASPDRQVSLVVCVEPRDPGNLGTIIRTAEAAGATAVVLVGDAVDACNPKVVRASAGSVFRVPVVAVGFAELLLEALRAREVTTLATTGDGEVSLFDGGEVFNGPVAWIFGNEAHGLPEAIADAADHRVRIPLAGQAESLNLSTAVAVCLFTTARDGRRWGEIPTPGGRVH